MSNSKAIREQIESIRSRILENGNRYFSCFPNTKDLAIRIRYKNKPYSIWERFYYVEISFVGNKKKRIPKKLIFGKRGSESDYNNMKYVWSKCNKFIKNINMPKPLDYIGQHRIILMEYTEGVTLLRYLTFNLNPIIRIINMKKMTFLIREIAKWLANYQNNMYEGDMVNLSSDLEIGLNMIDDIKILDRRSKYALRKKLNGFKEREVIISEVYSIEFAPRNIMVRSQEISVFDWTSLEKKHFYYDIHQFLSNMWRRNAILYFADHYIRKLEEEFLNEYYRNSALLRVDKLHFNLTKLLYLLSLIKKFQDFKGNFSSKIKSYLFINYKSHIKTEILKAYNELKDCS